MSNPDDAVLDLHLDRQIDARVADVWRHLVDLEGLPRWLRDAEDVEVCWDPPAATRRYRIGAYELEDRLLAMVPGQRIEMSVGARNGNRRRAKVRVDLAPTDDGGTHLAVTVRPEAIDGWLERLLSPVLRLRTEVLVRQLVLAFRSFIEETRGRSERAPHAA